jgi:ETC complex I subunit conserved region
LRANPDLRQSTVMLHARIYQKPKNAMQSGRSGTDRWLLEFQPAEAKRPDPLTGWAGSGDTRGQINLSFPTLDAAKAYANKCGITAHIISAPQKMLKLQAYADNFR